ncbi:MAG: hypothetical protein ABIQ64_04295 [Candidatus Saccharimonadales bacterium]
MKKLHKMKHSEFMTIGFALLFPGIFLAMILSENRYSASSRYCFAATRYRSVWRINEFE